MRTLRSSAIAITAIIAGMLTAPNAARAQPKPGYSPSSTHIFPAGGRRGTKVKVNVGAECIPPGTRFYVSGKGVTAPPILGDELRAPAEVSVRRKPTEIPITHPREWASKVTIADDAQLGPAYWRVSCAQGGTASRPFIVGDLPEFIETESNSVPANAEPIKLPVTVNGRISGDRDVDHFRFVANAGDVVVCEVFAGRIGSRLDPVVELLDSTGQRMAAEEIRIGVDPVLALLIESPGEYVLRIAHVTVLGGPSYVYRINISTTPFVHYAFPAGGQAGTERDVDFFVLKGTGSPQKLRRRIQFPQEVRTDWSYPLPSSATAQKRQPSATVAFAVDDITNLLETEPNNTVADAGELTLPVTVDGRTPRADDEDWFRFTAQKGDAISIRCQPFPAGTSALPTLLLANADGRQLATVRSIDTTEPGCRLEWTAPADGSFLLRVRDMQFGARGEDDFIYRLTLRNSQPDFNLTLGSDALDLMQGAKNKLSVTLNRFGGMNGAVKLKIEGLPDGVTFEPAEILAGKNSVSLSFSAAAEVPSRSYIVQLTGSAQIVDEKVQRTARGAHLGVDAEGVGIGSTTLDSLQITVQHKPLFRLFCAEAYLYAYRGSIFPYQMEVERLNGYDGEIIIQQGDRQNRDMDGINILNATIATGQTETIVPIYLPETMHINVQSQSQLYSQAYATFVDAAGQQQAMLVLSEKRNMLRTMPTVVKLKSVTNEVRVRPGQTVNCRLRLQRTTNFPGPMRLRLRGPKTPQGFTVDESQIAAGQTDVIVPVKISDTVPNGTRQQLIFRGTGELGKNTIVTETAVTIVVE
ncbi:MAG: hypothetical protein HOK71_04740 [Planctomycetaceae bacterium]|nr:hypothetical protein [Planctomycetaceae bacterium]